MLVEPVVRSLVDGFDGSFMLKKSSCSFANYQLSVRSCTKAVCFKLTHNDVQQPITYDSRLYPRQSRMDT